MESVPMLDKMQGGCWYGICLGHANWPKKQLCRPGAEIVGFSGILAKHVSLLHTYFRTEKIPIWERLCMNISIIINQGFKGENESNHGV